MTKMYKAFGYTGYPIKLGGKVFLSAEIDGEPACFFRRISTDELILPVRAGAGVALIATNTTPAPSAFLAELSNDSGEWINVFPGCQAASIVEMRLFDGMLEASPLSGATRFDRLLLPNGHEIPFEATTKGISYNDTLYSFIEVYYRPPSIEGAVPCPPEEVMSGCLTPNVAMNVGYQDDYYSFGKVLLLDRNTMAVKLANDGRAGLDPTKSRLSLSCVITQLKTTQSTELFLVILNHDSLGWGGGILLRFPLRNLRSSACSFWQEQALPEFHCTTPNPAFVLLSAKPGVRTTTKAKEKALDQKI